MTKTKRSLNKCKNCGDTWYPRGRNLSNKCPSCGSANVTYAGPGLLALVGLLIFFGIGSLFKHPNPSGSVVDSTSAPALATVPTTALPVVNEADQQDDLDRASKIQTESSQSLQQVPTPSLQQDRTMQRGGNPPAPDMGPEKMQRNNSAINSVAPSFDCAKAETEAARMICSSPALSQADVDLARAYNVASQSATDKQLLLKLQIDWQENVRDACTDVQCMLDAYQSRIRQLSGKGAEL